MGCAVAIISSCLDCVQNSRSGCKYTSSFQILTETLATSLRCAYEVTKKKELNDTNLCDLSKLWIARHSGLVRKCSGSSAGSDKTGGKPIGNCCNQSIQRHHINCFQHSVSVNIQNYQLLLNNATYQEPISEPSRHYYETIYYYSFMQFYVQHPFKVIYSGVLAAQPRSNRIV